jgi:hypothetical protein
LPKEDVFQFDVVFFEYPKPQVYAKDRMIPRSEILLKDLRETPAEEIVLKDLLGELHVNSRNRVPVVGKNGEPKFIIHRSMIDKFFSDMVLRGEELESLRSATLSQLLDDTEMAKMFEMTFVTVTKEATIDEARKAMREIPDCRDVFVTKDGTRASPVIGWLTNLILA